MFVYFGLREIFEKSALNHGHKFHLGDAAKIAKSGILTDQVCEIVAGA